MAFFSHTVGLIFLFIRILAAFVLNVPKVTYFLCALIVINEVVCVRLSVGDGVCR